MWVTTEVRCVESDSVGACAGEALTGVTAEAFVVVSALDWSVKVPDPSVSGLNDSA